MNKRIQKLAEQADEYASQFVYVQAIGHPGYKETFNQKFAELIVKECAIFSMVATDDHYDVDALYRHFGIEP